MKKGQEVKVWWIDIHQTAEWLNKKQSKKFKTAKCKTIGFVYKDGKKVLKLSHNVTKGGRDMTAIPKGCIVKIERRKYG